MSQTRQPPHIVFTGGGTGGHLFPALAVAELLVRDLPEMRITFAGKGNHFERAHVAAAGFEYLPLRCAPAPRSPRAVLSFIAGNLTGYRTAQRFLARQNAAIVVGLGGYASFPMGFAAVRRGVPLVLLEQNAVPGRATRWLAPSAKLVCTAMEQAKPYLRVRGALRVTGNPIRDGFARLASSIDATGGNGRPGQLLVLGGSGGARTLNESVPRALYKARSHLAGWKIVHQSGQSEPESVRQLYGKLGLEATVVPFITDMAGVLARTDLAICRSGGTTLAELAAAGVPAILLPYPHAADDHQRKNADVFTASGGCQTLDERELSGRLDNHLAHSLSDLLGDPERRATMSRAIRRLAHPVATWDVATMIRHMVGR